MKLGGDWVIEVVDPIQAQPLLNLLNVKYLLANPTNRASTELGFRISDRSDFLVFENLQAWPRAFFINQVTSASSNEEFTKQLLKNGEQPFVSLTKEAIEKQPGLQPLENTLTAIIAPATHYQLLPNSTAFDVHAASAGIVCLTEGQAKDFTAKANNEAKEILTVNRGFKGVFLDQPGDYHIEFTYRPRYWRLACTLLWISAGGVIALVVMSEIRLRRDKNWPTS
jgi:hypothetical protein